MKCYIGENDVSGFYMSRIMSRHNMSSGRCGGLVVETRTPEREVGGSILTKEAMVSPRHD